MEGLPASSRGGSSVVAASVEPEVEIIRRLVAGLPAERWFATELAMAVYRGQEIRNIDEGKHDRYEPEQVPHASAARAGRAGRSGRAETFFDLWAMRSGSEWMVRENHPPSE